jgi:ATP synthase H subunit
LNKAETLSEIKKTEGGIRAMKEAATTERDQIVREARREALDLQERYRRDADERAAAVLRKAEEELAREREAILAKGRREADAIKAAGAKNVDAAAELLVRKFEGALDA